VLVVWFLVKAKRTDVVDKFAEGSGQAFTQLFHHDQCFHTEDCLLIVDCGIAGLRQVTEC
jgi:hypothetical protein